LRRKLDFVSAPKRAEREDAMSWEDRCRTAQARLDAVIAYADELLAAPHSQGVTVMLDQFRFLAAGEARGS
jgi:uncharacterized protein YciW